MANQITVNSGSGNITVTTSRAVIGTVANVASANYANFAGEAFDVAGANVTGAVANATFAANAGFATTAGSATTAGTVTTAAQPNITSVGNLTGLTSTGNITAPYFLGNVVGNISGNLVVPGLQGDVLYNNAGNAGADGNLNYSVANSTLNIIGNVSATNVNGNGSGLSSITGANVSGTVANATYAANAGFATTAGSANTANSATVANSANSVTLSNVSGAGNIASINLDGNVANVLKGNGTFGPEGSTGNANYANFAGTAFSVSGSNVSGAVANATFALDAGNANIANIAYSVSGSNVSGAVANATFALDAGNANIANIAYSVSGANVSGAVANATFALDAGNANIANIAYSVAAANVTGLGNIATINLDGNVSNLLTGNGTFVAIPTDVANANYANFAGTVLTNAQPNITSVGNLSALTVTGNLTSNTVTWSNILTYNGSSTADKINVQADLSGAVTVRQLGLRAGNISNVSASNTTAGGILLQGGQSVSADAGNAFIARSGAAVMISGTANTANGAAFSGILQLAGGTAIANNANATTGALLVTAGVAFANTGNAIIANSTIGGAIANATNGNSFGNTLSIIGANTRTVTSGNAQGGNITIISGNARSENGNATSGNINITTASAVANVTAGTATVGSININTGTINGITAQVAGNINIGTSGALTSINLGQSSTSVIVPGNLNPNIVNANYLYGNGSNISNIQAANVTGLGNIATINLDGNVSNVLAGDGSFIAAGGGTPNSIQNGNSTVQFTGVDGNLNISTNNITNGVQVGGRSIFLNGANTGAGDISSINLINGALNWTLIDTQFGGGTPFGMSRYITGFMDPMNYYTARGNPSSQADVQVGDIAFNERVQVRYDSTTKDIFTADVSVLSFSPSNTVAATYAISSSNDQANSVFQVNFGTANIAGQLNTTGNVNVASGNVVLDTTGNITAVGRLDYLRTFGSFTSNVTQTNSNVGNAIYMTLNNDEGSNGVSIVSSSQITVARPGRYNIQFSAQIEKTNSGTDTVEVWLTKNGSAVANSATRLALQGNNEKDVAAWNWVDNASTANTYYQIAWGSTEANIQLTAIDSANTLSGVAVPSLIVTVVPVGA